MFPFILSSKGGGQLMQIMESSKCLGLPGSARQDVQCSPSEYLCFIMFYKKMTTKHVL